MFRRFTNFVRTLRKRNLEYHKERYKRSAEQIDSRLSLRSAHLMENPKERLRFMGEAFYYGVGVEKNIDSALDCWKNAYHHGDLDSGNAYAMALFVKAGDDSNKYQEAIQLLEEISQKNHGGAQFNLAQIYQNRAQFLKDPELSKHLLEIAKKLYFQSYKNGNIFSVSNLSNIIDHYGGTDEEKEDVLRILRSAVSIGEPMSTYRLAQKYYNGNGVPMDKQLALKLYESAFVKGIAHAAHDIGSHYFSEDNEEEALVWYLRGIEGGSIHSQVNYALLLIKRNKTNEDSEKAIKMLLDAASKGDALAIKTLRDFPQ